MSMNITTGPATTVSSATSTATTGSTGQTGQPIDYLGSLSGLTGLPFNPNTIINALLQADQVPIQNLQTQIKNIQTNESIYKSIGADVSAFSSIAFNLTLQSNVQANTAASSNTSAASATASPNALAGSYNVNVVNIATATTAASQSAIGAPVDPTKALNALNLNATPTAGTFSLVVDGKVLSPISVDPTQPLQNVLSQMQSAIATATGDSGVSVGIVNNKVSISTSGASSHSISFGTAGDTSNFLSTMNLSTVQGTLSSGSALTSSGSVGVTQASRPLASAGLATALTGSTDGSGNTTGSFSVNGVSIAWNAGTDALSDVIGRINSSSAGVTAQYNSVTDSLVLTNKATGQTAMNLQDTSGNFLAAMGLAPGTTSAQTLGANAKITVNGTTVTSTSNTITNAAPGLSITATAPGATTLTVGPDVAGVTKQVQSFVDAANKVLSDIDATQQKDSTSGTYSSLLGDPILMSIKAKLLTTITGAVTSTGAYQSLQDIGITTGAVGSQPGSTSSLTLDTTKLAAALTANPAAVAALFNGSQAANGFNGVARQLNTYLMGQTNPINGPFAQYQSSGDARIKSMQGQITSLQQAMTNHRKVLIAQFQAMSSALSMLNGEAGIFTASTASSSSSSSSSSSGG